MACRIRGLFNGLYSKYPRDGGTIGDAFVSINKNSCRALVSARTARRDRAGSAWIENGQLRAVKTSRCD